MTGGLELTALVRGIDYFPAVPMAASEPTPRQAAVCEIRKFPDLIAYPARSRQP